MSTIEKFIRDSDKFKIPLLRDLLSASLTKSYKDKGIQFKKTPAGNSQYDAFINFLDINLKYFVNGPLWKETLGGKLILSYYSPQEAQLAFNELKKLCETSVVNIITSVADPAQCDSVGVNLRCKDKNGIPYDINKTYPSITNINPKRSLWSSTSWCNNCWLCGMQVAEKQEKQLRKECEHILPFLTGSLLLGTVTDTKGIQDINKQREYGQSHSVCNNFKNQGEFIKYNDTNFMFEPDTLQINNYIQTLLGIPLINGVITNKNDVVSSNTSESFNVVYNKYGATFSKAELASDMYNTILAVTTTLCNQALNTDTGRKFFIVKLIYSNILNFLVDSQVRSALIATNGDTSNFKNALAGHTNINQTMPNQDAFIEAIKTYTSSYTTEKTIKRLANKILKERVKPLKYIINEKLLYEKLTGRYLSFGTKRAIQTQSKKSSGISGDIKSASDNKTAQKFKTLVKSEYNKIEFVFNRNTLRLILKLKDITFGSLDELISDDGISIVSNKIIVPRLVLSIYFYFSKLYKLDQKSLSEFMIDISEALKLENIVNIEMKLLYMSYLYGISIINLIKDDFIEEDDEKLNIYSSFGKKRILNSKNMLNIKEKLKSVGIRVTKEVKGKRKSLTEKEMNIKAESFKKLQLKAKERGIKLKNSNGKFKTKQTLEKELKKTKPIKINKFG